ncbi:DNA polymerase III delta prime subunit [Roseibacterium elongatum DSM 19469]|uniref:DNA polymerase III delta prime subunit n=1 Tax=Roseicyclus elongatus DSM 19469 TaxID=1294273 RepID=W8S2P8_9RHOB|nr:DNA polymerase III subunit delta' [Roseibacterium elongatum]AHM04452.1 DNA polymerase III delta prime subunit [Roseibacterium elongatum DSM 19469]
MSDDALPEADRTDGAPHPRAAQALFGQDAAEAEFLSALNSQRLPHGWLLTGPRGVGKATFAWRAARYLIATPPDGGPALFAAPPADSLDISPEDPVAHRLRALSEPSLMLLRRAWDHDKKRLKTQLTVDEVRGLKSFFSLSSGGGRRVVIVDSADEMNASAANALLKELEEPPRDTVLFLISHRPSGLLPTIRSRCRTLRFAPLGPEDLAAALAQAGLVAPTGPEAEALAALSGGSVGEAVRLISMDGPTLYAEIVDLLASLPQLDRARALNLAGAAAAKGAEARFDLTLSLLDTALARLARAGATGQPPAPITPGEEGMFAKLAPNPWAARAWAELAATLTARARQGKAVNLDPAALVFDMFLDLDRTAARLVAPA